MISILQKIRMEDLSAKKIGRKISKAVVKKGSRKGGPSPATGAIRQAAGRKEKKKFRILSIDGGGIRGVIPATILWYLEERLQERSGNPDARLSDYFDFFAGTSTGGILVCTYLTPDPGDPSRSGLTARQALDLYLEDGKEIFSQPLARKLKSLSGLFGKKYCAATLEAYLKKAIGETTRLSDLVRPCLITAYDINRHDAVFFNSDKARENSREDFPAWQVARATSAAPVYFEPAQLRSGEEILPLIDGGVFAQNPAMCAFTEAQKTRLENSARSGSEPEFATADNMILVSVGTGSSLKPYPYEVLRTKGAVSWMKPVVNIMMTAGSGTTDYQLRQVFDGNRSKGKYYRLEPELNGADQALDNVSPDNLKALFEAGLKYVAENRDMLEELIGRLMEEETP